jgi:hypothetical protein
MIFVLVFERLESAMKEGILYTVYQIRNNALQPERKPLFASLGESEIEGKNLSNLVNFAFPQIFVNKTVSYAVYWLRIDANNLLAHIPIAHFIPHHRSGLYFKSRFFRFRGQIETASRNVGGQGQVAN